MDGRMAAFIATWNGVSGSEIANYGLFLTGLCDALNLPRPDPATGDPDTDAYVFERRVIFHHPDESQSAGRIDLYKRGCFVLEAKQLASPRSAKDKTCLGRSRSSTPAAAPHVAPTAGTTPWSRREDRRRDMPVPCRRRKDTHPSWSWWTWAIPSSCSPTSL
ncbi:type IIL restriction-modification enzyme MmeI [Nitrospirillum sp. BR 11163]|uniref:type IIL restriction-modification enzyme MmeI n=1 Tax=Nitrospirillum sp. BR 11163 TaxID=3104323 RepID=UPI002AFFD396|nr:type IIL restriction-modification enzyme MmeI [Nitrospirillum sp. BR 11163]MEA1675877.1 type IIL restriction-modification enzyme MmeI [Nitrospirillum sp. BR 11163]